MGKCCPVRCCDQMSGRQGRSGSNSHQKVHPQPLFRPAPWLPLPCQQDTLRCHSISTPEKANTQGLLGWTFQRLHGKSQQSCLMCVFLITLDPYCTLPTIAEEESSECRNGFLMDLWASLPRPPFSLQFSSSALSLFLHTWPRLPDPILPGGLPSPACAHCPLGCLGGSWLLAMIC